MMDEFAKGVALEVIELSARFEERSEERYAVLRTRMALSRVTAWRERAVGQKVI